jgi:inner membrane protein
LDNLTHTLIGIGIARAGLSQKLGRGTTVVLAVSSNLPDIDVACLFGGPMAFLWRRTPTHSLVGAAILVVLATFLFRRYLPNLSWPVTFGLTALGVAGHVFADLWNAYGVVLFWPFNWTRVSLNWVYIIDLAIWGILIFAWALSRTRKNKVMRTWQLALALVGVYVVLCGWCNARTFELARSQSAGGRPIFVYPEPFGPQRFRAVTKSDDTYSHYRAFPFRNKIELVEMIQTETKTPIVEAVRRTDAARRLDWFFSTPVWRESPNGKAGLVYGLEFRSFVLKRGTPFYFRVTPEGQVSRERLVGPGAN